MKSEFIKFLNELSKKANNFEIPFDKYNYRRIPDFEQDYNEKSRDKNDRKNKKIKRYLRNNIKHSIINLDGKIIQDKHGFVISNKEIDSKFLSFKEKIKYFLELKDSFLPLFFKLAKNYNFIFIPENFEGKLKLFNFIDDFYSTINFILVDKNVKCDLIDEYININRQQPSILSTSLIFVKENSDLKHYVFTSSKVNGKFIIINNSVLYKNTSLKQFFACFSKGYVRYESNINLESEKAKALDYPIFFSWQNNFYDFLNRINHIARETFSRIEARGVLKDNARAVVRTKAIIGPKAINADSLINDYAILLSDKCHIDSIPSLEILNNNVKATHSAYTESIDKEKIFYMQTRGLDDKSAKSLYISGFIEKPLGNAEIKDKVIKDIQHLI